MSSYSIQLPTFQGPFDLLLFFIERDELDIYDIPISKITNDFLEYIHQMDNLDMEVASEFILVAATLMRIKSKMLLPRPEHDEKGNEIDPRQELVQHLLEYKRFKEVLFQIQDLEEQMISREKRGNIGFELEEVAKEMDEEAELESLNMYRLMSYFEKAMNRFLNEGNKKVHTIRNFPYTIEEQKEVLLKKTEAGKRLSFNDLIAETHTKIYFVFNFLAVLELVQLRKLDILVGEGYNNFWVFQPQPEANTPSNISE